MQHTTQWDFEAKATLYKTAVATIGCEKFATGDFVAVRDPWLAPNGVVWFSASARPADPDSWVAYPEHHLTRFCL